MILFYCAFTGLTSKIQSVILVKSWLHCKIQYDVGIIEPISIVYAHIGH